MIPFDGVEGTSLELVRYYREQSEESSFLDKYHNC
jgi:hypothetical protein